MLTQSGGGLVVGGFVFGVSVGITAPGKRILGIFAKTYLSINVMKQIWKTEKVYEKLSTKGWQHDKWLERGFPWVMWC